MPVVPSVAYPVKLVAELAVHTMSAPVGVVVRLISAYYVPEQIAVTTIVSTTGAGLTVITYSTGSPVH